MTTDTKEVPALHEDTVAMSTTLQAAITVDKSGSYEASADVYEKLAIEKTGLTKENLESLEAFNTTFFAASAHAAGEVSARQMVKDKKLDATVTAFPMLGKNNWEVKYSRSKEVNAAIQKAGEPPVPKKTIYGSTLGVLSIYSTGNHGEMSRVKKTLSAAATALFS